MQFTIHPINLIRSLSQALELTAGGLSRHHWRTAMIADRLAQFIGVEEQERTVLIYAGLLHDIGAASSWEEKHRLRNINAVQVNVNAHAEAGYMLLKDSPQLGNLAVPIRHHHDHWDGSSPYGLRGTDIPLFSRILSLADKLEVHIHDDGYILDQRDSILSALRRLSGTLFDPELVQALHELAKQESFWLDLANPHHYHNFFRTIDTDVRMRFQLDDVLNVAEIFSTIIDRTSRFTGAHSRSVAAVAAYLSEARGYTESEVKVMRIAGLFHDVGKLAIPNEILEKPGPLTDHEFSIIRQHPYYTYRILEQIDGFQRIAEWSAFHHESVDGTGYPFRVKEDSLPLGARIIAAADIFTALTENRPYRGPLELPEVEVIMRKMAQERKLDGEVVSDLFTNGTQVYNLMRKLSATY